MWLALAVRFVEPRYHGEGDRAGSGSNGGPSWPPAPSRVFQALVAASGRGRALSEAAHRLYKWFETVSPPVICAPRIGDGKAARFVFHPPPNDLDKVGGDPRRQRDLKGDPKVVHPKLIGDDTPLFYLWYVAGDGEDGSATLERARELEQQAKLLYQLGRGIDFAWAELRTLSDDEAETLMSRYPGEVLRPVSGAAVPGSVALTVPIEGSLESLELRHRWRRVRYSYKKQRGRRGGLVVHYAKRPAPLFAACDYDSGRQVFLYELQPAEGAGRWVTFPLEAATDLTVTLRDLALARLSSALPEAQRLVAQRYYIGRRKDGSNDCKAADRPRIVPVPSVGHEHVDHRIRRFLVIVPGSCPLSADDVRWSFEGLEVTARDGRRAVTVLCEGTAYEDSMGRRLGLGRPARIWRTVTPAALPLWRQKWSRGGTQAAANATRAAVLTALRHAEVPASVEELRVQREPFHTKGIEADSFETLPRFPGARLWHVAFELDKPVEGPIVIGDGRFMGLGICQPVDGARPE